MNPKHILDTLSFHSSFFLFQFFKFLEASSDFIKASFSKKARKDAEKIKNTCDTVHHDRDNYIKGIKGRKV
jgi:hypothetical protein